MKYNREYEIAWQGLKPGPHTYTFDIDDRFMQERGAGEDITNWNAQVTMLFDKHENFFMLHFDVDGSVTVTCDRCGDDFTMRLWDEFDLIIKLTGDEQVEEDDDDVVFIPRSETVIDTSKWIYEFVLLSIPLQHIHADKPDGTSGCNQQALNLLGQLAEHMDEPEVNPLWKGLEALREKNKEEDSKKLKK